MLHNQLIAPAYRILGRFWLKEASAEDIELLHALPELAQTLPGLEKQHVTDLAVEYQRLFGFNLPPYESIFIDPSVMLMSPATDRVAQLYWQGGWHIPAGIRTGAPDHLGLELLALADWLDRGSMASAHQLHTRHLALWVAPFVLQLQRLKPHPFYAALADFTLDLLLTTLPETPLPNPDTLFPNLPPPPVYRGTDETMLVDDAADMKKRDGGSPFRHLIKQLLRPCEAGLFLTRTDLARIGRALELPATVGDRYSMLETLFRQAMQYELLPELLNHLGRQLTEADQAYHQLAVDYPGWQPYAHAWGNRLAATQNMLVQEFVA
ncbi:MAG: molecular chaperone TorD family protein [Anaerolineae bacterium]|nr:molecular chaperone TorD family protein [Anaerolineae bacterium]